MILQQVVKEKMTEFYRNMFAEALGPDGNGGSGKAGALQMENVVFGMKQHNLRSHRND